MKRCGVNRRDTVDLKPADSAFAQRNIISCLIFPSEQVGGSVAEQRLMTDQKQMLVVLEPAQAEEQIINRTLRGKAGNFLQFGFKPENFGDNVVGLAGSNQRAGQNSI